MKKIIIIFFNYYYFINNYFSDLYIHILMYIYNQNIHVLCDQGGCTFVQDPSIHTFLIDMHMTFGGTVSGDSDSFVYSRILRMVPLRA